VADDLHMSSIEIVITGFVAAINLRLIIPGVLAFLGIWKPPASRLPA
jgi:hypothetical protein